MISGRSTRVVIDITQADGTVSGHMAVGDEAATAFFGWLELIEQLQSAAAPEEPTVIPGE